MFSEVAYYSTIRVIPFFMGWMTNQYKQQCHRAFVWAANYMTGILHVNVPMPLLLVDSLNAFFCRRLKIDGWPFFSINQTIFHVQVRMKKCPACKRWITVSVHQSTQPLWNYKYHRNGTWELGVRVFRIDDNNLLTKLHYWRKVSLVFVNIFFSTMQCRRCLSFKVNTFHQENICASDSQLWLRHQWERGDPKSTEREFTRKTISKRDSTERRMANIMGTSCCVGLSKLPYYPVSSIFRGHRCETSQNKSAVLCTEWKTDFPESVSLKIATISSVYFLRCTNKTVHHFLPKPGKGWFEIRSSRIRMQLRNFSVQFCTKLW